MLAHLKRQFCEEVDDEDVKEFDMDGDWEEEV